MSVFKSTGFFALVVILLLGYVYVFEYRGKIKEEEKKNEAAKVFSATPEDVIGFSIKNDKNEIALKKEGNDWSIVSPISDLADKAITENTLKQILDEKSDSVVAEGESLNLAYFGLDKPLAHITFNFKNNKDTTVNIGSMSGIANKKYIQLNQEKKVMLVGADWSTYFNKTLKDFRNKDIFKVNKDQIKVITIRDGGKSLTFEKLNGFWQIKGEYAKETDQQEANNFIQDLVQMNASDFPSEDKSKFKTTSDLKSLRIETVDGKTIEAKLFKNEKDKKYYLTLNDKKNVFEIYQRYWDMLNKSQNDFRDKNLPFEFDQSKVSQIDYKSDLVKFELKKDGIDWKSSSDPVDSEKVRELLGQLSNLKVQKFYGKDAGLFLHPKGTIVLKDQSGAALFNFQWGNEDNKNHVTVVKTNKNNELLGVMSENITKLPGQTILKKQANAKEEHSKETKVSN